MNNSNFYDELDKRLSIEVKIDIMKMVLIVQNDQIKRLTDRIEKLEQYQKDRELV